MLNTALRAMLVSLALLIALLSPAAPAVLAECTTGSGTVCPK